MRTEELEAREAREARRTRRYQAISARHLPDWAPDPIVRKFHELLLSLTFARLESQGAIWHELRPRTNPRWVEEQLAYTVRLCSYNQEMQRVWQTVSTTPVANHRYATFLKTGDHVTAWLLRAIDEAVSSFQSLPKVTPARRKKTLSRVATLVDSLQKALDDSPEAGHIFDTALADYIGVKSLMERANDGEKLHASDYWLPRFGFNDSRTGAYEYVDNPVSWNRRPIEEKFRWLHDTLQATSLNTLLTFARDGIAEAVDFEPPVSQPGRSDNGFLPFLIREVSAKFQTVYGKPLDSTVALLVSAIADLPEPLDRDGIRPYKPRGGKKSSDSI